MTRDRLKNYLNLRREIRQIEERLEELETRVLSPRTPKLSLTPKAHGQGGYSLEADMDKHADLMTLYADKLAQLYAEQYAIEQAVDKLDTVERIVIRARYIEGLTWEAVALRVNYSYVQTWRIHARAIEALEKQEEKQNGSN